jgi:hypothetical protein
VGAAIVDRRQPGAGRVEGKPMRIRRLTIAGVALVAAIGVAGCGPTDDKAAPAAPVATTTKPVDATTELAAAATKLGSQSMRVKMTMGGGVSMSGVADSAAQTADMTMNLGAEAGEMKMVRIGKDIWMKFDGALAQLTGGKKWLHMDMQQVDNGALGSSDPAQAAKSLQSAANVQRVGDHEFKGTLDLTKSPGLAGKSAAKELGAKANAVPFTATTDDQGRLVAMTVDMTSISAEAGTLKSTYSDFGTKVSVTAPPKADVTEMPKELAGLVN